MNTRILTEAYLDLCKKQENLLYYSAEYHRQRAANQAIFEDFIINTPSEILDAFLLTTIVKNNYNRELTVSFFVELINRAVLDDRLCELIFSRCSQEGIRRAILSPIRNYQNLDISRHLKESTFWGGDGEYASNRKHVIIFDNKPGLLYYIYEQCNPIFSSPYLYTIIKETDVFLLSNALNKFDYNPLLWRGGIFSLKSNPRIGGELGRFCRCIFSYIDTPNKNLKQNFVERIEFYQQQLNVLQNRVNNFKQLEKQLFTINILDLPNVKNETEYKSLLEFNNKFNMIFEKIFKENDTSKNKLSNREKEQLYLLQGEFKLLFDQTQACETWSKIRDLSILNPKQHLMMADYYFHPIKPQDEAEVKAKGLVHTRYAAEKGLMTALDYYNTHLPYVTDPESKFNEASTQLNTKAYINLLSKNLDKSINAFFLEVYSYNSSKEKTSFFSKNKELNTFEDLLNQLPKLRTNQSEENLKTTYSAIQNLLEKNVADNNTSLKSTLDKMQFWINEIARIKFPMSHLQKDITEVVLSPIFESIQELMPDVQIKLLNSLLAFPSSEEELKKMSSELNIETEIKLLQDVMMHPCPQNRYHGDGNAFIHEVLKGKHPATKEEKEAADSGVYRDKVYYYEVDKSGRKKTLSEPRGLLGLSSSNVSTQPITKEMVLNYIHNDISDRIDKVIQAEVALSLEDKMPPAPQK